MLLSVLRWRVVHGRLRVRCKQNGSDLVNGQSVFTRIALRGDLVHIENGVLVEMSLLSSVLANFSFMRDC